MRPWIRRPPVRKHESAVLRRRGESERGRRGEAGTPRTVRDRREPKARTGREEEVAVSRQSDRGDVVQQLAARLNGVQTANARRELHETQPVTTVTTKREVSTSEPTERCLSTRAPKPASKLSNRPTQDRRAVKGRHNVRCRISCRNGKSGKVRRTAHTKTASKDCNLAEVRLRVVQHGVEADDEALGAVAGHVLRLRRASY